MSDSLPKIGKKSGTFEVGFSIFFAKNIRLGALGKIGHAKISNFMLAQKMFKATWFTICSVGRHRYITPGQYRPFLEMAKMVHHGTSGYCYCVFGFSMSRCNMEHVYSSFGVNFDES